MQDKTKFVIVTLLGVLLVVGLSFGSEEKILVPSDAKCLPGSIEQWSNPTNADGSRIWYYSETDNCEVNS